MKADLLKAKTQENSNLYDQDYYLWISQTIELLHQGKFSETVLWRSFF